MLRLWIERGDDAIAATTTEGWLEIKDAVIARAGVLEYRRGDGSILRELRDPDVIHAEEALLSYEGKPVILGQHPVDPASGVVTLADEENMGSLPVIGSLRNVRAGEAEHDGEVVPVTLGDVLIWHPDGIRAARQGVRQWSTGYRTRVEMGAGSWDGEDFDARQTEDIGNHLVLTSSARAGDITEFRMDTADAICIGLKGDLSPQTTGGSLMATYTIGDVEGEVSAELVPLIDEAIKKADGIEEDFEKLREERDILAGKVAALEAQLAEEEVDDSADSEQATEESKGDVLEQLLQERLALIDEARGLVPDGYSFAGKVPKDIRADAVSAAIPDLTVSSMTEDEIKGAYLVALRGIRDRSQTSQRLADASRGDTTEQTKTNTLQGRARALAWYNDPSTRVSTKGEG